MNDPNMVHTLVYTNAFSALEETQNFRPKPWVTSAPQRKSGPAKNTRTKCPYCRSRQTVAEKFSIATTAMIKCVSCKRVFNSNHSRKRRG